MSGRYLGVISLERYLVVERYREVRQPSPTHPLRDLDVDRTKTPDPRRGAGAPAQPRHG